MQLYKTIEFLRKSTCWGLSKHITTFLVMFLLFISNATYAGSFTAGGSVLTLDLDEASQLVTVVSTGTTYTFTLSGGATNTWTGTTDANITVSGNVLTVTSTGLSTFGTINITDSQTGNAVTFNTSGTNAYSDNINITLNNSPGAVTFNGTSSFSGTNAINVTTSMYITFAAASGLSTVNGNLTLDANTQASPNNFAFSGIAVNAATVEVTGTGVLSMRARGGSTGVSASFLNKGIVVYAGGKVKGGTTGTATFEGWGYTGLSGTTQAQGVVVNGTGTLGTSTISSNGANVSVTGYGSNTTAAAVTNQLNAGVVVGSMSTSISLISTTDAGIISSGGTGAVVVTGYGGTSANPASTLGSASYGVYVAATSASITSGGDLTVTGIGGGPDSLGGSNHGVYVYYGAIISGTNGNLVVTGTGGNSKSSSSFGSYGVLVLGGTGVTKGQIKAGAGTGTTLVTGTGGGLLASGSNYGIHLNNNGIISSLGSGSVTVIGYGGNLNGTTSTQNIGVNILDVSIITSNGGNVSVEGTGGGGPTSGFNYGIQLSVGAVLSAGGSGTVTAIGRGGNVNGISGNSNHGVYVTSTTGSDKAIPYITSSGGNVTVTGTGGGGSSGSVSASASGTNYGVFTELGGYISAGGSGNVTVTGTGGNSSTGATGANNHGVYVGAFALKGTTEVYRTAITSGGGNVIINGSGGGNGASGTNYGVYNKGLIKATGAGTVNITGQGGNTTGYSNVGVFLDGAVTVLTVLYPATISSEGGNVTVTGTGGTVTSGSSSGGAIGVYLTGTTTTGGGGSIITAGGSGNVTVTGYGGQNLATSGGTNYGVYVNTGLSPNFSAITSGGGNVTVTGNGGGGSGASASISSSNFGVYLGLGGSITAGVNGTVSVTGNGGNNSTGGSGGTNYGVNISGGTTPYFSKITSNNGAVNVTGNGGGSGGTATNNYGVYLASGGQITSAGAATLVTVNGTGGASSGSGNHGTFVTGANSIITSGGGNLAINGTEGSSATSLALSLASSGAISTATNGGNITITGNSFGSVAGTSITAKSDGVVNIFPKTSGTTVGFASTTDARGSIYINTAELATITGGTINIGNSSTGAISISQAVTVPVGSNLNLATASSSAGLNPKLNGTEITMAAGKTLGLTGISSLNIAIAGTTVNTQYDQFKVVADVTLTGMTLSLSGAYTPTGGEVFTIVDATSITGIFTGLANGATVTFNGINLTINYTSTTVTLTAPCTNPTAGGTIAAAQSGTNPFTPAAFTSSAAASGQFGIVEYKWQMSTTSNSSGFADIASSNADHYTSGSLSQTTWFKRLARVSCKSDWTGAAESNVIEVTVNAINTWTGTTNNSFNTGTNWSLGTVPTSAETFNITSGNTQLDANFTVSGTMTISGTGSLTINPGKTLSISGTADFGGKPVTVKSDATGTGSIGQITGTLTGASNVTVERYINTDKRAWRLMTIPVTGQSIRDYWAGTAANPAAPAGENPGSGTLITGHGYATGAAAAAAGFDWFTGLGTSTTSSINYYANDTWNSATNTPDILSAPTKQGYLIYVRGDRTVANAVNSSNTTLRPTGTLKQGDQNISVNDTYELVGNPYASNIDLDAVYNNGTNNAKIERNFWLWDATQGGYGGFRSLSWDGSSAYDMGGGSGNAADYLQVQSGQAFFVQTKSAGSISISEGNKISGSSLPPVFFASSINGTIGKINANLYTSTSGSSAIDGVTVRLNNDYDRSPFESYDAPKLNNLNENLSIVRDGRYLGIESRPYPTASDTIYLSFWNLAIRDYVLKIKGADLGIQLQSATLIDRYTQQSTALNLTGASNDYGFSITANANSCRADRFIIVLKTSTVLPLSITKLAAQAKTSGIELSWQTMNEINVRDFDVERSTDGISFKKMGNVAATNGTAVNEYQLLDNQPATGWNYYRLRSNDANGQYSYSATVKALWKATSSIRFYPTISKDGKVQMELQDQPAGAYRVVLSNIAGQDMYRKTLTHAGAAGTYSLQLQQGAKKLAAGEYVISVYLGNAILQTQKMIIQ